ncbi:MAG: hypothetical protein WED33_12800 [Bacteroidia bacterium]
MQSTKSILLAFLAFGLVLNSCKKDEEDPETPAPSAAAPSSPIPAPTGSDGALVAIHTATYITAPIVGEIYQPIGVGVAVFGDLVNGTFENVGTVSLNGNNFTSQSNQSYVYTPSATDIDGIDLSTDINWNVSGGGSFSSFAASPNNEIPSGPKYSGPTTIPRTAAFTLSSSTQILSADSIIFNVISPSGNLLKTVAGNISSVEFTAAEMGTLAAGNGYVQIVPYNIEAQTIGGKQIYLINESVSTNAVTFQ